MLLLKGVIKHLVRRPFGAWGVNCDGAEPPGERAALNPPLPLLGSGTPFSGSALGS